MKKDKKLIKIFDEMCKKNDEEIKSGKSSFMPICAIVKEDYKIILISFGFNGDEEKQKMKNTLKSFIAMQKLKGYILIQDGKVTKYNPDMSVAEVSDVAMRCLYTPQFSISKMQFYKNGELGELITHDKREEMRNEWDLWGRGFEEDDEVANEINKKYNEYKDEHPELYKGTLDLSTYSKVSNNKGKLVFAFKVDGKNAKLRYHIPKDISKEDMQKVKIVLKEIKEFNKAFKYKLVKVNENGEPI
jgi:hypothetical protein